MFNFISEPYNNYRQKVNKKRKELFQVTFLKMLNQKFFKQTLSE